MNRLMQFTLVIFQILLSKTSYASLSGLETPTKVKDLGDYGINQNIVLSAFADEIQLNPDEIVRFKKHAEVDIIDFTTSDGRFRSIRRENEQPRNLTAGRAKFLLPSKGISQP